jgi:hypothetical protein
VYPEKTGATKRRSPEFLGALGVGVAGFLIGLGIFDVGLWSLTPAAVLRATGRWPLTTADVIQIDRSFLTWLFVACAQVALWFVLSGSLVWPSVKELRAQPVAVQAGVIGGSLILLALLIVPFAAGLAYIGNIPFYDDLVPQHQARIVVATVLALIFVLPPIWRIWLIHARAGEISASGRPLQDKVRRISDLREHVTSYLSLLGAMVGAVTTANALHTNFINAVITVASEPSMRPLPDSATVLLVPVPAESTILYGFYFTLLVAIIYVPAYVQLTAVARQTVDEACRLPNPKSDAWNAAYERRKNLEEYLKLNVGPIDNLRAGLAILAPFIGSLVGVALPGGR